MGYIKDYLSDDFKDATVSLEKTNKVNITRDGLMVRRENAEITPTLYLDGLYKDYLGGKDMHIILSEMAEFYMGDAPGFDLKSLLDKEYVMNNLSHISSHLRDTSSPTRSPNIKLSLTARNAGS